MSSRTTSFKTFDGIDIYERIWPSGDTSIATVVLIHDLHEHSGRYEEFAFSLSARGFDVVAMDLRGCGKSEGIRTNITSFQSYLEDMGIFLDRIRQRISRKPVFLFGNGLGGGILLLYNITRQLNIRGMILCSPMVKVSKNVSGFPQRFFSPLGRVFPKFPLLKLSAWFPAVSDPQADDEERDLSTKSLSARMSTEILRAAHRIQTSVHLVSGPALILHGDSDPVMDIEGSRLLYSRIKEGDKQLRIYSSASHDLFFGSEKEKVWEEITKWLDSHIRRSDR